MAIDLEQRRIAAIGRVRELIDRKVREGYAYQWWIDLDGPRLLAIVETVLDDVSDDTDAGRSGNG